MLWAEQGMHWHQVQSYCSQLKVSSMIDAAKARQRVCPFCSARAQDRALAGPECGAASSLLHTHTVHEMNLSAQCAHHAERSFVPTCRLAHANLTKTYWCIHCHRLLLLASQA